MANIVNKDQIKNAIKSTFAPDKKKGWIVLGYKGNSGTDIELQTSRVNGSVDELAQFLDNKQVQYAMIRIRDTKDLIDTVRDIMIYWSGPEVRKVELSKKKTHLGVIKELLQPHHASLDAIGKSSFNESVLRERSSPLSGSHVID